MFARRGQLVVDVPANGMVVGSYNTYVEAQSAVDHLSDQKFPVEHTTIVGNGLRQVEEITGRMTWPRALGAGLASGAWFGLFVGLLLGLFAPAGAGWLAAVLTGVVLGAFFGVVFGAVGYASLGGRRDFTSRSAIVATSYDVWCDFGHAEDAANQLAQLALRGDVTPRTQTVARTNAGGTGPSGTASHDDPPARPA